MADAARVVLASASPRRRELLEQLGVPVDVQPADVDETPHPGEGPVDYVVRVALEKASVVVGRLRGGHSGGAGGDDLVIAADTTVDLDGRILAKPADHDEARAMLRSLSARTHRVHTGVAVARDGDTRSAVVTTYVTFAPMSPATIDWYVGTGEPLDKAGAYAIQGAGGVFVTSVKGSVSNVVGLPLTTVVELARALGVDLVGR